SIAAVALVHEAFLRLGWQPAVDVLVTGNVGEEGLGDLRGIRAVLDAHPDICAAIAIEGHTLGRITHQGVGSRRFRVTLTGPGGHSWGDAGRPSAIHAAARLVARLDTIRLPKQPKTTLNVGLIQGGISVNTIAPEATITIDVRSVETDALVETSREVVRAARDIETADIHVEIEIVGDRPAGRVPVDGGVVAIGIDVLKRLGIDAVCDASSTDANIPMSRGVPAMCIGLAHGGNVHRIDEYIVLDHLQTGLAQLILVTRVIAEKLRADTLTEAPARSAR
ncbi:MAG: M20/M25/M40 family metallo-hydrolase, partial [Chloroflexia bacterium]|nr:M20/M25/M40 family metallo-hydrolase [Chloroflexia bacterium]